MRNLIFISLFIIIFQFISFSQNKIYAVIIGVSEYENLPEQNQLKYADKDALELSIFLKNNTKIDSSDIHLYLNKNPTNKYMIFMKIDQIIGKAKAGDRLIIYFAGHGDVQDLSGQDLGYLLINKVIDSLPYPAQEGVLELYNINNLISVAVSKGIKVLFITDACRSGSAMDNESKVFTPLNTELKNTTKLVSCESWQYSFEHKMWGGGHGVFTYYLLLGMKGLADKNNDNLITISELYDFVNKKVSKDTDDRQTPISSGSDSSFSIQVDSILKKKTLNDYKKERKKLKAKKRKKQRGILKRSLSNNFKNQTSLADSFHNLIKQNHLVDPQYYLEDDNSEIEIKIENKIKPHKSFVYNLKSSKSGKYIITHGNDNLLKIWSSDSLKLIYSLNTPKFMTKYHKEKIRYFSISRNEKYIVSGAKDNSIILWDLEKQKAKFKIKKAHKRQVFSVIFSNDNKYIISGGDDKLIKKWNIETGKLIKSLKGHKRTVEMLIPLNNKKKLLSLSTNSKEIFVWNIDSLKLVNTLKKHSKSIKSIALQTQKKRKYFASSTASGQVIIWDNETLEPIKKIEANYRSIKSIEVYNKYIFIPNRKTISIYNIQNNKLSNLVFNNRKKIVLLKIIPKLKKIIYINQSGELVLANIKLPKLKPSASYIFNEMKKINKYKNNIDIFKGELYIALQTTSHQTIMPFIRGVSKLPSINVIDKSINKLDYAFKLYPKESYFAKKSKIDKLLLQSYKIIITNNVLNYNTAVNNLKSIIKIEPHVAYPYNALSILYQKMNKFELSDSVIKIAIKRVAKWTEPKNNFGQSLLKQYKYEESIKQYKEIIKVKPNLIKAYNTIAKIYTEIGAYNKAEKYFIKSLEVDSLNSNTYSQYGNLQFKRGQFTKAKTMLNKSKKLDSTNLVQYLILGEYYTYLYKNVWREITFLYDARQAYLKAIKQNPYNPLVYVEFSKFYTIISKVDDETATVFLQNIFDVYTKKEVKEKTLNKIKILVNKALKLNPYISDATIGLAYIASMSASPTLAHSYYQKAIEKNINNPKPYYNYANYFESIKKNEKAIEYYKLSIIKDKKFLLAYIDLWNLYYKNEMMMELDNLYDKAIKIFPDSPIFFHKNSTRNDKINPKKYIDKALEIDSNYIFAKISKQNIIYFNTKNPKNVEISQFGTKLKYLANLDNRCVIVKVNDKSGVMSTSGEIKIPLKYDEIIKVDENLLCAFSRYEKNNDLVTSLIWMNYDGDYKDYAVYKEAVYYGKGFIKFRENFRWGLLNKFGKKIVNAEYDDVEPFDDKLSLIKVMKGEFIGCVNIKGKLIIPIEYHKIIPLEYFGIEGYRCYKDGKIVGEFSSKGSRLNY